MGKLRDYQGLIRFIRDCLNRMERYNSNLIVGFDDGDASETVFIQNPNYPSNPRGQNLLEPQRARDYVYWINRDYVQRILKEIEQAEKKEHQRQFKRDQKGGIIDDF